MITPGIFKESSNFITPEQRAAALEYLVNRLPPEILLTVEDYMYAEEWPLQFHFSLGQWVRNTLREQFDWDDLLLDGEWAGLVEEATHRFVAGHPDEQHDETATPERE